MKNLILPLAILFSISLKAFALQIESEHFIFYYESPDSSIVDSIAVRLEGSYGRITGDLQITINEKTAVYIYPTLQDFHNAIGWPDAPDWVVGTGGSVIRAVSPLNPGPAHSYNSVLNNVFVHEFAHICTGKINYNLPYWLLEGFALYEGGPYYSKEAVISAYNKLGKIPTLDDLGYNYDNFTKFGGYPFSLTIARFIVENFGMAAMRNIIHRPSDFSVFGGLSKTEFQNAWFDYVNQNYLGGTLARKDADSEPEAFYILQNYPNPFNARTTIVYNLATAGHVELEVFDMLGRSLTTLVNEEQTAGTHQVIFDASTVGELNSGFFFYRIEAGNFLDTKRMILLR